MRISDRRIAASFRTTRSPPLEVAELLSFGESGRAF
jgi:hypothetical protein